VLNKRRIRPQISLTTRRGNGLTCNPFREDFGCYISKRARKAIEQNTLVLLPQDILKLQSRVHNVSIIDFATGVTTFFEAQKHSSTNPKL